MNEEKIELLRIIAELNRSEDRTRQALGEEIKRNLVPILNEVGSLRMELEKRDSKEVDMSASLAILVQFLTNVNTITIERQTQLVGLLKSAGRHDLADAIALSGFASVVG